MQKHSLALLMPIRFRSIGFLLLGVLGAFHTFASPQPLKWVATWSAAPDSKGPELPAQTLRQIMRVSLGGEAVRIRISNEYGNKPLHIKSATIAIQKDKASIVPQSTRTLTINGRCEFTVPVGQSILSDAAKLKVRALQQLAVSLFFQEATGTSTIHTTGFQTAYSCLGEDQTRLPAMRVDSEDDSRYFVVDIEIQTKLKAAALVIVGDSTTDGVGTSQDSNTRWPDQLANRLHADKHLQHIAVINSGISGNRLLNDGLTPFLGPSTLKRFDRDALSKPGVRWVLLLQGINDITANGMFEDPQQKVTVDQIIAAMKNLIERAHSRGLHIIGATLLPRQGAKGARAHTPAGEAMRLQINEWIRSTKEFDAFIDFDKRLRDPAKPDHQLSAFNSGDFSHPNSTGYREMAEEVDLTLFNHK